MPTITITNIESPTNKELNDDSPIRARKTFSEFAMQTEQPSLFSRIDKATQTFDVNPTS